MVDNNFVILVLLLISESSRIVIPSKTQRMTFSKLLKIPILYFSNFDNKIQISYSDSFSIPRTKH